jgi:hypothetical protein
MRFDYEGIFMIKTKKTASFEAVFVPGAGGLLFLNQFRPI